MARSDSKASAGETSVESPTVTTTTVTETVQENGTSRKKKKKKKRRTSAGLRDADQFVRRSSNASSRLARAVAKGFRTYAKETNKSSRKKRDGAIRDALENWSLGLGASLRAASRVPNDVVRAVNTRTVRRQARCVTRLFALPFAR